MVKIYAVEITTYSCDIMWDGYIDSYWTTEEKAEDYILKEGLLDKGFSSVEIVPYELDRGRSNVRVEDNKE